jgi:phospholipid/cholesterol/gamma-HCH transport system ATP-binding protein
MITLEDVATEEFGSIWIEVKEGSLCKIITQSEHEKQSFLDTILAFKKPAKGRVLLFDVDIYAANEKALNEVFHRIGMVWKDGGLISNLKVWENIVLPVWYHKGKLPDDAEQKVADLFQEMGIDKSRLLKIMGILPGLLPAYEKKLICMVRSMLMEPDLMIYDAIFEGINIEMAERLTKLTTQFHTKKPGRTSIYISADEKSLRHLHTNLAFIQQGEGFTIWS